MGNCGFQLTLRQIDTVTHLNTQTNKNAEKVILSWKHSQFTIYEFALANDEPRGAWKTLVLAGFGGGSAHWSALRADQSFGGNSDFEFLRYLLDEVRMYFELNPDDVSGDSNQ